MLSGQLSPRRATLASSAPENELALEFYPRLPQDGGYAEVTTTELGVLHRGQGTVAVLL